MAICARILLVLLLGVSNITYAGELESKYDFTRLTYNSPLLDTTMTVSESLLMDEKPSRLSLAVAHNDSLQERLERLRPRWRIPINDKHEALIILSEDKDELIRFVIRF